MLNRRLTFTLRQTKIYNETSLSVLDALSVEHIIRSGKLSMLAIFSSIYAHMQPPGQMQPGWWYASCVDFLMIVSIWSSLNSMRVQEPS
ncbi:hypothetical protein AVEN_202630-1 [Araneus ventricosus]|uniref:Uncharacterized protein n=1 Tax=Araneus ventricosus TaxID=182803 RepID=A0A4Y2V3T9_ARAVE|nr:hypothetical protein AVEN_202630-1 [Araneus ventricosus]